MNSTIATTIMMITIGSNTSNDIITARVAMADIAINIQNKPIRMNTYDKCFIIVYVN